MSDTTNAIFDNPLGKGRPTPKNPQRKNPLRRAMKGKSASTRLQLAKQSLNNARIEEIKEWAKQHKANQNNLWALRAKPQGQKA